MSKVAITGNASGAGVFTIASPDSATDRTLTLPDETGTMATQAYVGTQGLGVGQNWIDFMVLGGRAQNVTYYNTTGQPIEVSITSTYPTSGLVYVNGVSVATVLTVSGQRSHISFIVPDGQSYQYTAGVGSNWSELR